MFTTIFDDGTRCQIQGEGDPNTLGVTLTTTCTSGVYFNDKSGRGELTVWVWNSSLTTWVARP